MEHQLAWLPGSLTWLTPVGPSPVPPDPGPNSCEKVGEAVAQMAWWCQAFSMPLSTKCRRFTQSLVTITGAICWLGSDPLSFSCHASGCVCGGAWGVGREDWDKKDTHTWARPFLRLISTWMKKDSRFCGRESRGPAYLGEWRPLGWESHTAPGASWNGPQ